jgi:hypothetical protein
MTDQEQKWAEYRKRKNQALFVILGYIPICFTFDLLTVKFFRTDKSVRIFALFWGLMWVVTGYRFIVLPCPSCGRTVLVHPFRSCARDLRM